MNGEELTKFRLDQAEKHLQKLEEWHEEMRAKMAEVTLLLGQVVETNQENKKAFKGLMISLIIGVTMLVITTIVAKLT